MVLRLTPSRRQLCNNLLLAYKRLYGTRIRTKLNKKKIGIHQQSDSGVFAKYKIWINKPRKEEIKYVYGDPSNIHDPFIIINKPAGLNIQDEEDSVEKRIQELWKTKNIIPRKMEFPLRLDKWAAGLCIVSFDPTCTSTIMGYSHNDLHKRFRLLAQIPQCVLKNMHHIENYDFRFNAEPLNSARNILCCLGSEYLDGSLLTVRNMDFSLTRKGTLSSFSERQTKFNQKYSCKKFEDLSFKSLNPCCLNDSLSRYNYSHPFIIRHLLYRTVPDLYFNNELSDQGMTEDKQYCNSIFIFNHKVNWTLGLLEYDAVLKYGKPQHIRLQFAGAGFPIYCDPQYNPFFIHYLREEASEDQRKLILPPATKPTAGPSEPAPDNSQRPTSADFDFLKKSEMGFQAYKLQFPHPLYPKKEVNVEIKAPTFWPKLQDLQVQAKVNSEK